MLHVHRILHPTDFSPCSDHALVQAVRLARHFGAELHVLHVTAPGGPPPAWSELPAPGEGPPLPAEPVEAAWPATVEALAPGRVVKARRQAAAPAAAILEYAAEQEIDLVVMGTHGRRGLDRMLIGSVAEQVVREAQAPVMTVHAGDDLPDPGAAGRILVGIDLGPSSRHTLRYARELALAQGASLEVLYVYDEGSMAYLSGYEPMILMPDTQAKIAAIQEALKALVTEVVGEGKPVDVHIRPGDAAHTLAHHAAERGCAMLVVGSHGHTDLRSRLLGSVAEKVVRMGHVPVCTVRRTPRTLAAEEGAEGLAAAR